MALNFTQLVLSAVALWALWRFFRFYITKDTLDNVPGPVPHSYLTGDMEPLFHRHEGWKYLQKLEEYGPIARVRGVFGSRVLFVYDPVALQHMAAKDGVQYEEPDWVIATNQIIFGPGLLSASGAQHRRQRKMLNSIFSTENMRKMTPMFYQLTHKLRHALAEELVRDTPQEIDVVHWMGRAALEYVAQGGMGRSFDSLAPHSRVQSLVGKALKSLVPILYALNLWRVAAVYVQHLGPPNLRRKLADMLISISPDKNLGRLRDVVNTIDEASRTIYIERSISGTKSYEPNMFHGIMDGNDILSIMLKANARSDSGEGLSEAELLAQISTMLFAGTDTTSNALSRILQALSEYPDVQVKLREELASARDYSGQDIPYDRLMELPLLDAVCRETLRLHSPVNLVPRETLTDVVVPLQKPVRGIDGNLISELPIPKGTLIISSVLSCNTSKAIWGDDALEWKPDRWLSPLPATVSEARIPGVYSNLMTFGGGSRSCVGFRFAQLEMKVVLSVLLESFSFSLADRSIIWNMSGVNYPTMDETSIEPSLYLKVKAL